MNSNVIKLDVKTPGFCGHIATLTCYIPEVTTEMASKNRPAVVICPGGGYEMCAPWEGEPIALCFAAEGIPAFVLDYSVKPALFPQALCEAAAAISCVKENAGKFCINPKKTVIAGFSAGGHLAACLGVFYDKPEVLSNIGGNAEKYRPAGMILGYPVITSGEKAHRNSFRRLLGEGYSDAAAQSLSIEKIVTEATPPAFVWHTFEDSTVPVENSLMFVQAMAANGVNTELHIFPHGNHGLSLASDVTGTYCEEACSWTRLAVRWLKNL